MSLMYSEFIPVSVVWGRIKKLLFGWWCRFCTNGAVCGLYTAWGIFEVKVVLLRLLKTR